MNIKDISNRLSSLGFELNTRVIGVLNNSVLIGELKAECQVMGSDESYVFNSFKELIINLDSKDNYFTGYVLYFESNKQHYQLPEQMVDYRIFRMILNRFLINVKS